MSKYLLDEHPQLVFPNLAALIGLHEQLVLQQINYWVAINEKAKNNFKDGFYWTYNTYEGWLVQFPYMSLRTLKGVFHSLEAKGFVISGNFNKNSFDRTKWYRIDHNCLDSFIESAKCKSCTMESATPALSYIDTETTLAHRVIKPEEVQVMRAAFMVTNTFGRKPRKEQHG